MRVLFTTQPAPGHLHPLVPLAQALGTAGHEVMFACSASFCPTVKACGFTVIPAGLDWLESAFGVAFPRSAEVAATEGRSAALSWVNEEVFASATAAPMAEDVLALSRDWRPDVIVRDHHEYGGYLAAETLGLPHATVEVGAFRPAYWRDKGVARQLDRLRAAHGLAFDPDLLRLYHFLHLSFVPPSYQDAAAPLPPTAHVLRTVVFDRSGEEALPAWIADLPNRATVYATLGTVSNRRPDIFHAILAGLRGESLNLILTVGRNQDPADFGRQPPNVYIERYIPQSLLLPHCDVLVSHGGFNSVLAAIAAGLPQVVIPLGADQPDHARRCAALGVARVIPPDELSPEAVRRAVREVLTDAAYRANAARLRDEASALPGLEHGIALLERLAAEKTPLVAASYSHSPSLTSEAG
jgi:UDP:flavonoid glycosyltransferase YjiC (YdhE family)